MSNSDPQDEATQQQTWPETGEAPASAEDSAEPAPSWLGYPAESTEYTAPHTYTSSGISSGYATPPPSDEYVDYADYTEPQRYEAAPEGAPDVPAGAGFVPQRPDAVPPVPPVPPAQHDEPPVRYDDPRTTGEIPSGPHAEPNRRPAQYPAAAPMPPEQPAWGETSAPAGPPPAPPGRLRAPVPPPPPAGRQQIPSAWPAQTAPPQDMPRPEDLLLPDRPAISDAPATWGWRGRVNRMSAGAIKPKAKSAELVYRQAVLDIQHGFSRPMTVVVIQPKGGAGKTPTAIGLAAALGAYRGGYVVGWDDNETRGTLAVRTINRDSQRTTVWDFLGALPSFERLDARVGDLSYYVRSQGEAYFDALVSDDHPGNMAQIGEQEFRRIHNVLQRFYRIIVIDTGNNVRSPNWQAAVNAADVVVIPSTYQRDVGYSGSWVLDHLLQTGREDLAQHSVTVLTAADPTTDGKVRRELQRHFGARTQHVVEIPFDEHIATGGPIHWSTLADDTRHAYTELGAVVVNALVRRDQPVR